MTALLRYLLLQGRSLGVEDSGCLDTLRRVQHYDIELLDTQSLPWRR